VLRLSFTLGVILATGCVGTLEPLDPGGDDGVGGPDAGPASLARQMFDSEVSPMLGATCASCHTGPVGSTPLKFLGTGAATGYYTAITTQTAVIGNFVPTSATLLTKGAHEGAPAWTATQADTISMWLLEEATERQ
jgi:hypothetical protein